MSSEPSAAEPYPFEMTVEAVAALRSEPGDYRLLDVREPWELAICRIDGSLDIPLDELPARLAEVPADGPLIVLCHHGQRSAHATLWLRRQGRRCAVNMKGGIDAWARRVDRSMALY